MKINSKFTRVVSVGISTAMLATTLLTAVPASADVSAVTASTNNASIAANGTWDIRFTTLNAIQDAVVGGNITITFPSGFTVNNSVSNTTGYTIAAGPGWLSTLNFGDAVIVGTTSNSTAATRTILISLAATDVIGAGAQVRITLPVGVVTNPSTAGSYALTVATSNDTTAISSNSIVVTLPNIGPLPGQVEGKNTNGDVLYRNIISDLSAVIATPGVSTIELGAGTYNASNTATVAGQTIKGVGAAGTVIMTGGVGGASVPLTVSAVNVTLQNLTFTGNPSGDMNLLAVGANNTTIKNCTFTGGVNQVAISYTATSNRTTVSDCIFNVTGNVTSGITTNGRLTTNSTFNVDNGGTAIIASNGALTVAANAKFVGTSGTGNGIVIASTTGAGASTITSASFSNLGNNALVSGGNATNSVQVSTSTFTGCGNASATSSSTDGVITASGSGDLILINNTIANSAAAAYGVYVAGNNVTGRFNTITNTLNVKRASGTADFANNWWGSANGAGSSSISGTVTTSPYLSGMTNSPTVVFSGANVSGGTPGALPSGVDVACSNVTNGTSLTANVLSVAKYAANPQSTAPSGNPIAYYDVYVAGASTESGSTITIKFFAAGLNANSKVYFASATTGGWVLASNQAVAADNSFVIVTVNGASSPTLTDMGRTPFVVTNVLPPPAAPTLGTPTGAAGATVFSWSAVDGATSYKFQVSTTSTFATTVSSQDSLSSNAFGPVALAANTSYFWRVQAVNAQGNSAWVVGTFATAAPATGGTGGTPIVTNNVTVPPPVINVAPPNVTVNPPNVTVNPPQVTVTAPPPANVTVNPPQVTVQPPPPANVQVNVPETTQAVPSYILWTIILIGAVLVIALIVLIVRTRRVS